MPTISELVYRQQLREMGIEQPTEIDPVVALVALLLCAVGLVMFGGIGGAI